MALKRDGEKAPTKKVAKKTTKKTLTPAQMAAEELSKDKKANFKSEVIFDPTAPLATAKTWVDMPAPWQQLTGVRGVPYGHITTIQGKPDTGKTTIAMHAMVEAQEQGHNVVLIDTEHKFNKKRLHDMGGDVTNILFLTCDSIEEGFDAIDRTIVSYEKISPGVPVLFVWDSLGMTPTEEELNGDAYKITVGSASRVIKKNLRREVSKISSKQIGIVFINHIYDNINAMFGNSTKGYGGNGAYFASVIVIEVAKVGQWYKQVKGQKVVLGLKSKMKCTKNHMAAEQGKVAEVKIGELGIDGSGNAVKESQEAESFIEEEEAVDYDVPDFKGE